VLAKLQPVIGEMADAFWLAAILDPDQQRDVHAVAQAMAAELLDESYVAKHILLEPPAILELDSLGSQTDRALFTQSFLLWLFYFRLAERKSPTFKHAVIVEEAQNLFLRRSDGQQSIHDLMLRQMRDLGQTLVLPDQNPSLMSTPALGNTGVTICPNLKHGDDVDAAGKALTLPRDDRD